MNKVQLGRFISNNEEKIGFTLWAIMGAVILAGMLLPLFCRMVGVSYWFIGEGYLELFRFPSCVWLLFSLKTVPPFVAELACRPMSRREEERMFAKLEKMANNNIGVSKREKK